MSLSSEFKFLVCQQFSLWGYRNCVCLSICLYPQICPFPEKRNHPSSDSMDRSSRLLQHGDPKKVDLWKKKVEIELWLVFWLVPKCWNHPRFVNIIPTVVIGIWLERFSWVLQHKKYKKQKKWFSFKIDAYLNTFLLPCFVKKILLILCTLVGLLSYAIHKNSSRSQHICVKYMHIYSSTSLHHWTFIL